MSKVIEQLKNDPQMPLRHSAEHVLHLAMQKLYPALKKVMGPPIEDGFYFDFDLDCAITPEDFPKIEKKMQEIIDTDLPIKRHEVSLEKASELFTDNDYKLEWLKEIEGRGEKVSLYTIGEEGDEFYEADLCSGPHAKSTGEIKAFKLLSVAGAYYKGDEKNKMLQRIYGTAFDSKEKLKEHLANLEEAKKRDHRKIGKDLELFMMDDEVGQGLILWLPKGAFVRHKAQEFAFNTYLERGYEPVFTPNIASEALWKHSGHLDFYSEGMYNPFGIDKEMYRLKPMNCPFHVVMYKSRPRSYRELPIRWTEMGTVYRYEKSGTLHGLTRVRGFTQDDAHIICTPEQLLAELVEALDLTLYILKSFGFEKFELNLAVRDPENKAKFIGSDEGWEAAEETLKKGMAKIGYDFVLDVGGAIFYGPKIDFKLEDCLGRKWQLSTIQMDFNLPSRFKMSYISEDGNEHTPFMIHRALLGSLERFMGIYIEHTGGEFPVWLAPTQVVVIPIGENHILYAQKVAEELKKSGLRGEIANKDATMQAKIREAQRQKIPYMLIVGDNEVKKKQVSVRLRGGEDLGAKDLADVIKKINSINLTKSCCLW